SVYAAARRSRWPSEAPNPGALPVRRSRGGRSNTLPKPSSQWLFLVRETPVPFTGDPADLIIPINSTGFFAFGPSGVSRNPTRPENLPGKTVDKSIVVR